MRPSETRGVGDRFPANRLSPEGDPAINADRRNNVRSAVVICPELALETVEAGCLCLNLPSNGTSWDYRE